MDWFVVKVSLEVHNLKKRMIRIKDLNIFFSAHTCLCKWFLNMEHFLFLFFVVETPQIKRFDYGLCMWTENSLVVNFSAKAFVEC